MTKIQLIDNTKEQFLELLSSKKSGGSISAASTLAGVSRQTIYNWRMEDNSFDQAIIHAMQEGKTQIADLAEQALIKRIEAGDTTAVIFTLKTLRSARYGDKEERNDEYRKQNEKTPEVKSITDPEQIYLKVKLVLWHCETVARQADVLTPKLEVMFSKLKQIVHW